MCFEGWNNIDITNYGMGIHGLKLREGIQQFRNEKSPSLVQRHAPTSSIEDEPIFIKFDEDGETPNNVSHDSDDSSNGQSSASMQPTYFCKK
jgi:hypothetical protein